VANTATDFFQRAEIKGKEATTIPRVSHKKKRKEEEKFEDRGVDQKQ